MGWIRLSRLLLPRLLLCVRRLSDARWMARVVKNLTSHNLPISILQCPSYSILREACTQRLDRNSLSKGSWFSLFCVACQHPSLAFNGGLDVSGRPGDVPFLAKNSIEALVWVRSKQYLPCMSHSLPTGRSFVTPRTFASLPLPSLSRCFCNMAYSL